METIQLNSFGTWASGQIFPSEYNHVVMDMSGDITLYEKLPKPGDIHWVQGGNSKHWGRMNFHEYWKNCIYTITR